MNHFAPALFICLLSMASSAQNAALFTIGTTGSFNLKLTFNGKNYSLYDKSVTFQNIPAGSYPVIIYQAQRKADGTFGYNKVYEGNLALKAGRHTEVLVMRYGKTVWDEGNYSPDDWTNSWVDPIETNSGGTTTNRHVMSDEDFALLLSLFRKESNEYNRKDMAPGYLKGNLFTARQIAALSGTFSNEYIRLDFATMAYSYCFDKGTYFLVAETFDNRFLKQQLMDFVTKQR